MERLQKDLGLEVDDTTQLLKIARLERGIKDMKGRMDEFDQSMPMGDKNSKSVSGTLSEPLCIRVWNIENELRLEGEGHSMSERISMIERSFNRGIRKLED
eukprot:15332267-Ditylum_brightwellii.AAC.1